ncbi:malectin domain-containing carbohydrate-binding protein [Hufsiella ginkgonis]|uniref:DUF4982 domain-containing protein n=1 Tax=Hufsiella ginkgonis TaxID=2695274 RepID=A0A7K1XW42_9SPHI|nr:malectin domain-containing carbohydrate-binding protein [Hufsiella ginkgonis]MXV15190.1 DUF4982 domain-containing protein [Hufsiella ginkgonis]
MDQKLRRGLVLVILIAGIPAAGFSQPLRRDIPLNAGWLTAESSLSAAYKGFETRGFAVRNWTKVTVPHNWDAYGGYRRLRHGNLHGFAWYRKTFTAKAASGRERFFLWFEGVGSYATVYLNGKLVGKHAGGRTSFTLDVTAEIYRDGRSNLLAVFAGHPADIRDLPWVCGGCSEERGFSEGSQPMGIFRPVHLIVTDEVRIEPFGVHAWNNKIPASGPVPLFTETTVRNYGNTNRKLVLRTALKDADGKTLAMQVSPAKRIPGSTSYQFKGQVTVRNPHLWSLEDPHLYQLVSEIVENGKVIDRLSTLYGIRWISWPDVQGTAQKQFLLNGKPVFINGIAEYEHMIGKSHAFDAAEVRSRVMQIKAAGFNAFRDAHQPHNLRYQAYWDKLGILSWTQMAAHIWYDTPAFRANFKNLLTEWVKERRNSPSVILWGLENESTLPEDFAKECTQLIRQLDPTASSQRKVTTCNGGKGTDWDVPQNWTGTYGGNPADYANDVKRQVLIGEYGAWRTADLHTEGPFNAAGALSEDRMARLIEQKIRLAESVKDSVAGQYFWLFNSHDNPGRVQGGEGKREIDRVGPVNYKGLLTPWEEPLDVYYLFRSNYAPKTTQPMVYIVSHTWPDRWTTTGEKDSLVVYSNCDEVELFNDVGQQSLGKRSRGAIGNHFQWDDAMIRYNVLYAVGYVNGKAAAKDYIVLNHLPEAPGFKKLLSGAKPITAPEPGYHYLYRVNCGGPDYTDTQGNTWLADRPRSGNSTWGSSSWAKNYPGTPSFFASQRRTSDPIQGTADWKLFQDFRYGLDQLRFDFPVPDGNYRVELYFTEPWLGTGGGMDCTGWRLFDVAVNEKTVICDLDIWKESGHDGALKKVINAHVTGGVLTIHFPGAKAGQALISAIAVASLKPVAAAPPSSGVFEATPAHPAIMPPGWTVRSWLDTGEHPYTDSVIAFSDLPPYLYGAEWVRKPFNDLPLTPGFLLADTADVFVGIDRGEKALPDWLKSFEDTGDKITTSENGGRKFMVFKKRFDAGSTVSIPSAGTVSAGNYLVAAIPAARMQPAYDLKPVKTYKATDGLLTGNGIAKEHLMDKERVVFKKAAGDQLIWTITTGVADIYSLTIKYHNPLEKPMKAKISVISKDGTVILKDEPLEFLSTKSGKWNYLTTNTGSMVNAGQYKIILTAEDAAGLFIDTLDVQ